MFLARSGATALGRDLCLLQKCGSADVCPSVNVSENANESRVFFYLGKFSEKALWPPEHPRKGILSLNQGPVIQVGFSKCVR